MWGLYGLGYGIVHSEQLAAHDSAPSVGIWNRSLRLRKEKWRKAHARKGTTWPDPCWKFINLRSWTM